MKIRVVYSEGSEEKEYEEPVRILDIVKEVKNQLPYRILMARLDKRPVGLDTVVDEDSEVELLDLRDRSASFCYQTGLKLLFMKAVHDVAGKQVRVTVANSLSNALFVTVHTQLSDTLIQKIEERMRALQKEKNVLRTERITRERILKQAKEERRREARDLIANSPDVPYMWLCSLEEERHLFVDFPPLNTGYLETFELKRYKSGILIRFALAENPTALPEYREDPVLYDAFSEQTRWAKITQVDYAYQLNALVQNGKINDLILLSEALHEKEIAKIAESIYTKKKRIILIAGPSSSGKTTFAKRLCVQLRVLGLHPLYLGTDDYYLEREETPFGPDGKRNFEVLEALDLNLFNTQMNALLKGEKVAIPTFNFVTGKKEYAPVPTGIDSGQPIVIEGLFTLDPRLTKQIDDGEKFKIYISPLTQLNIDEDNYIPTTDARLLRRIARDANTRNISAAKNIDMWQKVREGESKNVFPFNTEADVFFNSQCLYELAVLKKIAKPQLQKVREEEKEYAEAQRLLRFLQFFVEIDDTSAIPCNSIIREFIGGSVLR